MRGETSGFNGRKPSDEYSDPKKLVTLMRKVQRHPEFAAVFYAENRTTDALPRTSTPSEKTGAGKKSASVKTAAARKGKGME